jgi:hypothetical protein
MHKQTNKASMIGAFMAMTERSPYHNELDWIFAPKNPDGDEIQRAWEEGYRSGM